MEAGRCWIGRPLGTDAWDSRRRYERPDWGPASRRDPCPHPNRFRRTRTSVTVREWSLEWNSRRISEGRESSSACRVGLRRYYVGREKGTTEAPDIEKSRVDLVVKGNRETGSRRSRRVKG